MIHGFKVEKLRTYGSTELKEHLRLMDAEYRRSSASVKREEHGRWQTHAAAIEQELTERLKWRNK
jgi:hypothetical protein|tara:strand:- start:4893 stop:5087 length:195 start_codon:yes stop_codon:yes gene_type:complete